MGRKVRAAAIGSPVRTGTVRRMRPAPARFAPPPGRATTRRLPRTALVPAHGFGNPTERLTLLGLDASEPVIGIVVDVLHDAVVDECAEGCGWDRIHFDALPSEALASAVRGLRRPRG